MVKSLDNSRAVAKHRSQGGGWVAVQFGIMALQTVVGIAKRGQWRPNGSGVAGAAFVLASAAYALPGARSLGRNLTPLPEPKREGELVTTGIYGRVRHPLYASVMAGGFGWALLLRSWPALILGVVQAVFLLAKAKNEESRLRTRFPKYAAYARQVPRFIPRVPTGIRRSASSRGRGRPLVLLRRLYRGASRDRKARRCCGSHSRLIG